MGDFVSTEAIHDSKSKQTIEIPIIFNGNTFTLACEHSFVVGEKTDTELYRFDITDNGGDLFNSGIALRKKPGTKNLEANLLIRHLQENNQLLDGVGRIIYNKLLDFLQKLANDRDVEITHYVQNYQAMNENKWRKIFSELVEPRNYEKCEGQPGIKKNYIWKKLYSPNKQ